MDTPNLDFSDLLSSDVPSEGLDCGADNLLGVELELMCPLIPELQLNENYVYPSLICETQNVEVSNEINKDDDFVQNLQVLQTEPSQDLVFNYEMLAKESTSEVKKDIMTTDDDEPDIEEHGTNKKTVFKCPYCFDSIESFCLFILHLKNHGIDKNIFKCEHCVNSFDNMKDLQSHKASCHSECLSRFICELCSTSYKRKYNLVNHMKKTHSKEHLICALCEKLCLDAYAMMRHYMEHERGFLFLCKICNYGSNESKDYNAHVKKHDTMKKHKCDFCDKYFGKKFQLKRHLKIHCKPKKFECNECPFQFVTRRGYLRHIRMSHKSDSQNSVKVTVTH